MTKNHRLSIRPFCFSICIVYFLVSYHQAWADLALLQKAIKKELKSSDETQLPQCLVTISLVEKKQNGTNQVVPGLLRVLNANGKPLAIPELLNRGKGLKTNRKSELSGINSWYVIPQEVQLKLPQSKLTLQALSGLETELTQKKFDFTDQKSENITLTLNRFSDLTSNYKSANTHLHIMKLSREECDQYLNQIPFADRLDLVFISHLERAIADRTYITNRYTKKDLTTLSREAGVIFGWGEEHRHNSSGYDEGYGHVMLLDIQKLIQPVSIGPGIMKQGTDGLSLSRGIKTAIKDKATIIWCHNAWGMESTPNIVQGDVHAVNIFDGGTRSTYEDSFYRYLNAGYKIPFSTGTDWFQYDFSRVYADVESPLSTSTWLASLKAGRTYITNGPLLDLRIGEKTMGDQLKLDIKNNQITIRATGKGRIDFKRLELIHNGKVIASQASSPVKNHFEAVLELKLMIDQPGWIALRTPSPSVPKQPNRQQKTPLNEYGREIFSHTSPVYLEWEGQTLLDQKQVQLLLREMMQNREKIAKQFLFADDHERAHVLDVYSDGIQVLSRQLKSRK